MNTTQMRKVFEELMSSYDNNDLYKSKDSLLEWKAKCEWLVKSLVDVKFATTFKYINYKRQQENEYGI